MDIDIHEELVRLAKNSQTRRDVLFTAGSVRLHRRKFLSVLSGVLALISAGTTAVILSTTVGEKTGQLLAAAAAFVSGIISLVINVYLNDEETVAMMSAASKYLAVREGIRRTMLHIELKKTDGAEELEQFRSEYMELDDACARFFPPEVARARQQSSPDFMHSSPNRSLLPVEFLFRRKAAVKFRPSKGGFSTVNPFGAESLSPSSIATLRAREKERLWHQQERDRAEQARLRDLADQYNRMLDELIKYNPDATEALQARKKQSLDASQGTQVRMVLEDYYSGRLDQGHIMHNGQMVELVAPPLADRKRDFFMPAIANRGIE